MKSKSAFHSYYMYDLFKKVAETGYGWFLATIVFIFNYFSCEKFAFTLVLVAILLDAFFGIIVAVKNKKFILSRLGQFTMFKITSYFSALVLLFMIEKLIRDHGFIGVKIAAGWAAACEFWSMSANILAIWPTSPFFKLIRKQLKAEIASKLGNDVEEVLKD